MALNGDFLVLGGAHMTSKNRKGGYIFYTQGPIAVKKFIHGHTYPTEPSKLIIKIENQS